MRLLAAALIFATALSAQRFGGGGGRVGGGGGGFRGGSGGGMGYRGPTMGRPGGGVGIGRPGVGIGHPGVGIGHHPGIGYRPGVGYRWPVYSSFGYGYGYYPYDSFYPFGWGLSSYYDPYVPGYGYASTLGYGSSLGYAPSYGSSGPNVSVVTVPSSPQPPVYIINQAPYQTAAPAEERPLATKSWAYIIATKSGTVWIARDYAVRNGNVELTTTAGEKKTIPLAEIDRDTTEELNRERGVTVQLQQPLRQ